MMTFRLSIVYNDCSKKFSISVRADSRATLQCKHQQHDVQEETVEDLASVMAHLGEGLHLRSVSCKWLGRMSSQGFWVD